MTEETDADKKKTTPPATKTPDPEPLDPGASTQPYPPGQKQA